MTLMAAVYGVHVSTATTTIRLPELLPHGAHVGAGHAGGASGASASEERQPGHVTGTLVRFDKRAATGTPPQAFGWIKATYRDAIEYSGSKEELEGMVFMFFFVGGFLGLLGAGCGVFIVATPWMDGPDHPWWADALVVLIGLAGLAVGLGLALWSMAFSLRHVWRVPRDLPIIFDRRHRKVYRILQDVQPGIAGLFWPWPVKAVTYEWDLIDAEHDAQLMTGAGSAMRIHRLAFVVRRNADDPTIIDHFEIGKGLAQAENMIAPMWEHIRRFMEERGPHLPDPTEPLDSRQPDKPTWWQACGRTGPFGNDYLGWWKRSPGWTLYHHAVVAGAIGVIVLFGAHAPVWETAMWVCMVLLGTLPMTWGRACGIWLLAHTSPHYDWPQAVKEAIGPAMRRGTGWVD